MSESSEFEGPLGQEIDSDKEREWDRLDSQGQFTNLRNREESGMVHVPDDIERKEVDEVVTTPKKSSRRRRSAAQSPGVRALPGYDNEPDPEDHPHDEPRTEEERLLGVEQAKKIIDSLGKPEDS